MSELIFAEQASAPSTPASGKAALFVDTTGTPNLKILDDSGFPRVVTSSIFSIVPAGNFNLLTTSGVQSAFPTTGDVITLDASTAYFFKGQYLITHTTTTCTAAMAFAAGGGASVTSIAYEVSSNIGAAVAAPVAPVSTWVNTIASTVVTATSTVGWCIRFEGILRMNAGGTITPQINWSANTTAAVMKVDSYIRFEALGTSTTNTGGNVA